MTNLPLRIKLRRDLRLWTLIGGFFRMGVRREELDEAGTDSVPEPELPESANEIELVHFPHSVSLVEKTPGGTLNILVMRSPKRMMSSPVGIVCRHPQVSVFIEVRLNTSCECVKEVAYDDQENYRVRGNEDDGLRSFNFRKFRDHSANGGSKRLESSLDLL